MANAELQTTCADDARTTPVAVGVPESTARVAEGAVRLPKKQMAQQKAKMEVQPKAQQKQMDAMLERLSTHVSAPPVAATSVPSFAPFDPASEL